MQQSKKADIENSTLYTTLKNTFALKQHFILAKYKADY